MSYTHVVDIKLRGILEADSLKWTVRDLEYAMELTKKCCYADLSDKDIDGYVTTARLYLLRRAETMLEQYRFCDAMRRIQDYWKV